MAEQLLWEVPPAQRAGELGNRVRRFIGVFPDDGSNSDEEGDFAPPDCECDECGAYIYPPYQSPAPDTWRLQAIPAFVYLAFVGAARTFAALAFRVNHGPCGVSALRGLPWDVVTDIMLFVVDTGACRSCSLHAHDRAVWYAFDEMAKGVCPRLRLC